MTNTHNEQDIAPPRLGVPLDSRPVRIAFVAALLPIAVLGAVFLAMLNAERVATLERAIERAASAAGMAIRRYVGEEIGRLEGLAVSAAIDTADWTTFHAEATRLLALHPHWLNIIVTDENRQLFNARMFGQLLPPVRDPESVRRVLETRQPAVGNLVPGASGLGMAFRVPVLRDGTARLTLVAPAQPALFSRVLREQGLTPGWTALAVDARNVVIGHSDDAKRVVGEPLEAVFAAALPDALHRMVRVRAADGTDYHMASAMAGPPGWHVIVLAPPTIAGGSSQIVAYAAWAAIAAGAVLAVVLVGALLTAAISRRNLVSLARANNRLRASEARQQLLAREIDHRSKNVLALVQSILRLTRGQSVADYARAAQGRIAALGRAHTLLSQARWEGADLGQLVADELAPHRAGDPGRIAINGPGVALASQAAQSIAMAVHELTTNAVKYGALAAPGGRVAVSWAWHQDDRLELRWQEQGGPPARPPAQQGFGMQVIARSIGQQLEGEIHFDWHAEGLRCTLRVPRRQMQRAP